MIVAQVLVTIYAFATLWFTLKYLTSNEKGTV